MWYFSVQSENYGREEYGPYDSEAEAQAGISRIQAISRTTDNGVLRFYTEPYEGSCDTEEDE